MGILQRHCCIDQLSVKSFYLRYVNQFNSGETPHFVKKKCNTICMWGVTSMSEYLNRFVQNILLKWFCLDVSYQIFDVSKKVFFLSSNYFIFVYLFFKEVFCSGQYFPPPQDDTIYYQLFNFHLYTLSLFFFFFQSTCNLLCWQISSIQ